MVTSHQETHVEEIVNAITHGIGFALSAAGLWFLLQIFWDRPLAWLGAVLYGSTLTWLYLCSALYHACPRPALGLKQRLQRLDHVAIFLFMAGSYTPFCLMALPNPMGTYVLTAIWIGALLGSLYSLTVGTRFPTVSMLLYMIMGWMALFILPYLLQALSFEAMAWMIAGAAAYMLGSVFFATHWFRFSHALWHVFVIAGSGCHYMCVWHTAQCCPY